MQSDQAWQMEVYTPQVKSVGWFIFTASAFPPQFVLKR